MPHYSSMGAILGFIIFLIIGITFTIVYARDKSKQKHPPWWVTALMILGYVVAFFSLIMIFVVASRNKAAQQKALEAKQELLI